MNISGKYLCLRICRLLQETARLTLNKPVLKVKIVKD